MVRRSSVRPADLTGIDIILGDMIKWGEYRWRLSDLFHGESIDLRVRLQASNTLALIGLVTVGLGVTIFPESLISFLGRSVEVWPIIYPDFRIQTILVWKRTNRSTAIRRFI